MEQSTQPHLTRLLEEKSQLDERIVKLSRFIYVDNAIYNSLHLQEKLLLLDQLDAMKKYSDILNQRLIIGGKL